MRSPLVTVIGEALIDLVPGEAPGDYQAHAGGSPFNVAVALARLRESTALMARLSDHGFGQLLRDRAAAEDIDGKARPQTDPTPSAGRKLTWPRYRTSSGTSSPSSHPR